MRSVRLGRLLLVCWLLHAAAQLALAQGVLINARGDHPIRLPRPVPREPATDDASYRVRELRVEARLIDQVARVQLSQTFENTSSQQLEVSFVFPLPYDGAIDRLTLLIDGEEHPAELLDKDEARRRYEEIVRRNRDPALLEWLGKGMFQTSVFPVPPGAKRTVSLRYTQLCRLDSGLTDLVFPLAAARYTNQPLERLHIEVTIESSETIKNVYSPTHDVDVERRGTTARIELDEHDVIPTSDFRLLYSVDADALGARLLSYRPDPDEPGYFLLWAAPTLPRDVPEPPRKTIVCVIDRSGSMSGEKIEQAQGALRFVLQNLREGDLFNIVAYDSEVESFRPELQKFNSRTRREALAFVDGLFAGGSTNISGALSTAFEQLVDNDMPSYLLFLTDGLPTAGETDEAQLAKLARDANDVRARLVVFGVGYDVNSRLLDKLARENHGQSEYVGPEEDIEDRVSRLYRRIQSPVLTDLELSFELDGQQRDADSAVNRVYPRDLPDLFAGESLVLVGRYRRPGDARVIFQGQLGDDERTFHVEGELVAHSRDDTYGFIEKLWAVRRVGQIIDEIDLDGRNEELIDELVELSTRHGILTPYTSFLVEEDVRLADRESNNATAGRNLQELEQAAGAGGFAQRALKQAYRGAQQATAPAPSSLPSLGVSGGSSFGSGLGGDARGRFAGQAPAAAAPATQNFFAEAADEQRGQAPAEELVRQIGRKTFFRRTDGWIDSSLSEQQQRAPQRIEQFSAEYFALAERHGARLSQYLVFDDPVMLEFDGTVYQIEAPRSN